MEKASGSVKRLRIGQAIALVLVFLEMVSAQRNQDLQCHLCGAGEPARLCNGTSNIVQCRSGETCFTRVDYTRNGLTTRKGCMERRRCERYQRESDALCAQGVVSSRCSWCCDDDRCNNDRFEYSHTTPRPTQPDTTTAALITLAPPTCDVKDFTKCITDFSRNVDRTLQHPRKNFPDFCHNVPDVFLCVMGAFEDCSRGDKREVERTLKSVSIALLGACPGECSPAGAEDCTTNVIEKACTEIVTSTTGDPCTLLVREFYQYEHCVTFNTGVCTDDEKVTVNTTVSLIKREIDLLCNDSQPTTTEQPPVTSMAPVTRTTRAPATTATPQCRPTRALACITRLGKDIAKYLVGKGDLDTICRDKIPETEQCVAITTSSCSNFVKKKIDFSFHFVTRLIGDHCRHGPPTEAPKCDTLAARACVTKLFGLIDEADDFQSACQEVNSTKACVEKNAAACTDEEKESLQDFLDFVLNRIGNRCENLIKSECNKTITLVEGGSEEAVEFTLQRSPEDLCRGAGDDCRVFVDVVVETGSEPQCKDGKVISQVVVRQDNRSAADSYCSIEITQDNWQDAHRFVLAAKIDLKFDGNQTRNVTLVYRKMVGDQVKETRTLCTYKVIVIDRDDKAQCKSINDPHITTFDGHYYNHHYEGVYTLYRHKYLPYEVQSIYQRCHKKATCNCGLAVRSGDFVFFADRCRRKATVCGGRNSKKSGCGDLLETFSYEWDNIPAGTRIFRDDGGRSFQVLLPHGTLIKIKLTGKSFFNVWIYPSPFDWDNTEGLCGTYDGNIRNDLTLPDGTVYTGRGSAKKGQPKEFNKAWRVVRDDIIYHGVDRDPFYPDTYCEARPDPMHAARTQCVCAKDMENMLVETCEFDTSGEIRFDIYPSIETNDILPHGRRSKREATQAVEEEYDIDLDFEPPEIAESGDWTTAEAEAYCRAYLEDTFESAKLCLRNIPNIDIDTELTACTEDILITGGTEWSFAALDDLKEACQQQLDRNSTFTQTPWGTHINEQFGQASCLNDCSNRGRCENGKCICNQGWVDIDCSLRSDAAPEYLSVSHNGLCSTRHTNCSVAVVFGQQFINSDKLTCHLQRIEVTSEGVRQLDSHLTVPAVYFTLNQVLCRLPAADAFLVDVSNDGETPSGGPQVFVPHDPACFDCVLSLKVGAVCLKKTSGHCMINGKCYAEDEKESQNSCNICKPDESTSEWSSDCSLVVHVIAAVIVVLLVVAVLIVVGCCCWCRKRKNAAQQNSTQQAHYSTLSHPLDPNVADALVTIEKPVKMTVR